MAALIEDVDSVYRFFGAGGDIHGQNQEALARLKKKAAGYNLELIPALIRHIGTEVCGEVLRQIRDALDGQVELNLRFAGAADPDRRWLCFRGQDGRRSDL